MRDDYGAAVEAQGWHTVPAELMARLPVDQSWLRRTLDGPLGAGQLFLGDLEGDRLVHFDARADNILLRADGTAVIIDWPWAARGAAWIDAVCLLFNVAYFDAEFDPRALLESHPAFADVSRAVAARFLFATAGHFLCRADEPEPPGIPGLRRFQRDQAMACLRLVRALTS